MERLHALDTARNVLNSKIAKVLLEENKLPHRNLQLKVEKINSDVRRSQALYENKQRLFKKQGLIYNFEPTIVVERPSSPEITQNIASENFGKTPHYMTDLEKNRQAFTTLPSTTVDAFKVTRKRKKNLWEEKYSSKDLNENFRSIILKSPPLTSGEQLDLDKGWTLYRPVSRLEESLRQLLKSKKEHRRQLAKTVKPKPLSSNTFITQLASEPNLPLWDVDQESLTRQGNRQSRRTSNSAATALLQEKIRSTAVTELNKRKLQQFEDLRERQKRSFHQYLK